MIHNLTHDEYAIEYVKGVREANPQEYPTWEMLETAFVAGMTKAQELYGQPRPRRGHIPLTEGQRPTALNPFNPRSPKTRP